MSYIYNFSKQEKEDFKKNIIIMSTSHKEVSEGKLMFNETFFVKSNQCYEKFLQFIVPLVLNIAATSDFVFMCYASIFETVHGIREC